MCRCTKSNLYDCVCSCSVFIVWLCDSKLSVASWQGGHYPPEIFGRRKIVRKSSCCRNILLKNTKFEAENPILGKFRGNIEMFSTRNFLHLKIAIINRQFRRRCVGKLQLPVPPTYDPRRCCKLLLVPLELFFCVYNQQTV